MGVFNTGVVLKNNRDLLADHAKIQQLKMLKEQHALKMDEMAQARKDKREGKWKGADIDLSKYAIHNDLSDTAFNVVSDLQDKVAQFHEDYNNGDNTAMQKAQKAKLNATRQIQWLTGASSEYESALTGIYSDDNPQDTYEWDKELGQASAITDWNSMVSNLGNWNSDTWQDNFSSNYSWGVNEITNPLGDMDLYAAYSKDLTASEFKNEGGDTFKGIQVNSWDSIQSKMKGRLAVNPQGGWEDTAGKVMYLTEPVPTTHTKSDGSGETYNQDMEPQAAFFYEVKDSITPEPDEVNKLNMMIPDANGNPQRNPNYDSELASEYVDWLSQKHMSILKEQNKTVRVSSAKPEKGEKPIMSQEDFDRFMAPSEKEPLDINSIKIKTSSSAAFVEATRAKAFKISLNDLIDNEVQTKAIYEAVLGNRATAQTTEGRAAELAKLNIDVEIIKIAMTVDNQAVAIVDYKGTNFVMPANIVSKTDFKKDSDAYKMLSLKDVTSTKINTSKYNK